MEIVSKTIDDYCTQHTTDENELLKKLNRETHTNVLQPRMLSGHFQGRLLALFSKMIQPNRILEIGTYTGYSALCLAEGLKEGGKLITIDVNEEIEDLVKRFINNSDLKEKIELIIGNASEIIPQIDEKFDIVFIDADKRNYSNYYDLVFDKVKAGGYIIADNVLWSGKVIDEKAKDKDTELLREFNLKIQNDTRVENILLPIRDGLIIARKL